MAAEYQTSADISTYRPLWRLAACSHSEGLLTVKWSAFVLPLSPTSSDARVKQTQENRHQEVPSSRIGLVQATLSSGSGSTEWLRQPLTRHCQQNT